ncbi:oligopeptide transporter 2 [Diutina catenulata]
MAEKEIYDTNQDLNVEAVLSQNVSIEEVGYTLTNDQKLFIMNRMDYEGLEDLSDIPPQVAYMIDKIEKMTPAQAFQVLQNAIRDHSDDVNIMQQDIKLWQNLVDIAPQHGVTEGVPILIDPIADSLFYDTKRRTNLGKSDAFVVSEKKDVVEQLEVEHKSIVSENDSVANADYTKIFDWDLQVRTEGAICYYYSPYPQVRACCDPYDEEVPCETFRVYFLGVIATAIGAVVGQLFSTRTPTIYIGSQVIQILAVPCGHFLAAVLPTRVYKIWRWRFTLNPGPWSHKEQLLVTLFYSVTNGISSYANNNIHVQKMSMFYGDDYVDFGYQCLLMLSANFIGFGLAGILRKFAVYPTTSIWPTILPTLGLNKALIQKEKKESINGWTISRFKFFLVVFVLSFIWYWIPDFVAQFLSWFNWMTWIKPDNLNLANITGMRWGAGITPWTTFDFNQLTTNGMYMPLIAVVNTWFALLLSCFIYIGMYYSNYLNFKFIPMRTYQLYSNKGKPYNVQAILNERNQFDEEKYLKIGPPFFSAGEYLTYAGQFLLFPFAFFYEITVHWRPIWSAMQSMGRSVTEVFAKNDFAGHDDPFCRQNQKYREVPEWVFTAVLLISLIMGICVVECYPTGVSCWVIFFSIAMNFIFLIPITCVYSRLGFSFGLNVLIELIVGYACPGNPNAINIAKNYGYNIDGQAENYITNQKQAHYLRIPPRSLFRTQMLGVLVGSFVQLGMLQFMLNGGIKDYCDLENKQGFFCLSIYTFFNASIQWGVIGPKRVFNGLYPVLPYCFLIGFLLVFPAVAVKWYLPTRYKRYWQPTLWLGNLGNACLALPTQSLYVSLLFMGYLYNRYNAWWSKYAYVLASAIPAGIALAGVIIFFALEYTNQEIDWWGNSVFAAGMDWSGKYAHKNATLEAPDGYFGPRADNYP